MLERLDLRAAASRVRSQWCELARTVPLALCRRALAERAGETVPLGLCRRALAERAGEGGRRGASSAEMGRRKKGAGALRPLERWPW